MTTQLVSDISCLNESARGQLPLTWLMLPNSYSEDWGLNPCYGSPYDNTMGIKVRSGYFNFDVNIEPLSQ